MKTTTKLLAVVLCIFMLASMFMGCNSGTSNTPTNDTEQLTNNENATTDRAEDTIPEDTIPEDTTPEDTTPKDTTPEDTTPESTTPEDTMPEDTTPNESTAGLVFTFSEYEQTYTVSGYEGTATKVVILSEHNGFPVVGISEYAFADCFGLTSITIPESVKSISPDAFYNCSGLSSITVHDNNSAYYSSGNCLIERYTAKIILGCKTSVIPQEGDIVRIGDYAFSGCTGLTSITIPHGVDSIGVHAFEGCSSLTSITIPESVTRIGYNAFKGCSGLTSITIPNSVTNISDSMFQDCSILSIQLIYKDNKVELLNTTKPLISQGLICQLPAVTVEKWQFIILTKPASIYLYNNNDDIIFL